MSFATSVEHIAYNFTLCCANISKQNDCSHHHQMYPLRVKNIHWNCILSLEQYVFGYKHGIFGYKHGIFGYIETSFRILETWHLACGLKSKIVNVNEISYKGKP